MKLAANTIDGVYEVNSIPVDVSIYMDDFYDVLASHEGGTIYGIVSSDIAKKIDTEYGIHRF